MKLFQALVIAAMVAGSFGVAHADNHDKAQKPAATKGKKMDCAKAKTDEEKKMCAEKAGAAAGESKMEGAHGEGAKGDHGHTH